MRAARAAAFVVCCALLAVAIAVPAARAQRRPPADRDTRTLAQQKIDPPLLREIYRRRGDAAARHVPPGATGIRLDRHGRTYVAVHAPAAKPLQRKIAALGGRIVSTNPEYQTVVALMPVTMLERLAADPAVRSIAIAPDAAR